MNEYFQSRGNGEIDSEENSTNYHRQDDLKVSEDFNRVVEGLCKFGDQVSGLLLENNGIVWSEKLGGHLALRNAVGEIDVGQFEFLVLSPRHKRPSVSIHAVTRFSINAIVTFLKASIKDQSGMSLTVSLPNNEACGAKVIYWGNFEDFERSRA